MSVIDWASKPEPWCWIGPQFKSAVERIACGETPTPPRAADTRGNTFFARPRRSHRPAVPGTEAAIAASTARKAEIAEAKAALNAQIDARPRPKVIIGTPVGGRPKP